MILKSYSTCGVGYGRERCALVSNAIRKKIDVGTLTNHGFTS
ncbi:hypothetical protein LEP1GSC082_4215 [Leptospira kirschneri str. H2]|nr:hypothetical protein LEP1GSC082_4215 [Leptospira kirschneri str. H2]